MKFCIKIISEKKVRYENLAPFVTTNFPSRFFLMGFKNSAPPHASFILTRKNVIIILFASIYILLSRYSNNRNLNLCLLSKYYLGGLNVLKRVFFLCFYVRDNRVFLTGGVPPINLKFFHPPHQKKNSLPGRITQFYCIPLIVKVTWKTLDNWHVSYGLLYLQTFKWSF